MTPLTAWRRKLAVMASVSRRAGDEVGDGRELLARVRALNAEALAAPDAETMARSWWKMESLAFAFFEPGPRGVDLGRDGLPFEAGPAVHTGLGMAAVLHCRFDVGCITRLIETAGDPRFSDFADETLGLLLAAYEPDLFGRLIALSGRLGLLRRPPLRRPDVASLLAGLPPRRRQLAAHGYGRMLCFKSHRFASALERARRLRFLPFEACVRGITIAYALINCRDLDRILALGAGAGGDVGAAIDGGLVDSLLFFAWTLPGFLDRLEPRDERSRELIRIATEQAADARARGLGPPLMAWSR